MTKHIIVNVLETATENVVVHTQLGYEEQPVAPIIIRD